MSDDATTPQASPAPADAPVTRRCPWCSETLPDDATERCPHCNAHLKADGETHLPGLTEVESPLASKARRLEPPKRSKLLSWISGDVDDELSPLQRPSAPEALAPPPRDVRREMLRLQLEAEGITVAPDGSIALPVDPAASSAPSAAAAAGAPDAAPDAEPGDPAGAEPTEIRKAS